MVLNAKLSHTRRQGLAIGLALMSNQVRMGCTKNDIDCVRTGFDDFRHGIDHSLVAFTWREKAERENDRLSAETEFCLGVMRFEEREIRYSVRYDLNLRIWGIIDETKEFAAFFCHDNDLGRSIDDPTHHVALGGRRVGKYRVKCRDNRHFEARQELDDIAAGLPAKNSVFMLKGNNVEACIVQELGRVNIIADFFVVNLKAHSRRIVIGATEICHCDDAGLKVRTSCRARQMKIMGKGSDSAAARKMIADECYTLDRFHRVISRRPSVGVAFA